MRSAWRRVGVVNDDRRGGCQEWRGRQRGQMREQDAVGARIEVRGGWVGRRIVMGRGRMHRAVSDGTAHGVVAEVRLLDPLRPERHQHGQQNREDSEPGCETG